MRHFDQQAPDRWVGGLAFFLATLSLLSLSACEREGSAEGRPEASVSPLVTVQVERAEETTREARRRYSGYSYPWESHGVGFLVAGRVVSVDVEEGDRVEKGQLLATLAPDDYALVERLAAVQVRALRPNYLRVRKLVKKGALPSTKLDELRGKYEAAVTQREQAARQVGYTRLEAPCAGVVLSRETSPGQVIGQGMPAVVLLDMSRVKVKFGVTQNELGCFHAGEAVSMRFPGLDGPGPKGEWSGTIHRIALVPDMKTRTYDVVVEVANPERRLRAGMLAILSCAREKVTGFFVPLDAVKRDRQGQRHVLVVEQKGDGATVARRDVELGRVMGDEILITSGLTEGDRVIVRGQAYVKAGERVAVVTPAQSRDGPVEQGR